MTFTEAAVEVLRLVGKPLHYKKITEVAIERNLLSHVGKTPEVTMSSRLATMVKRDRGEAPIIKVKPGVFGLREFNEEQLADLSGDLDELPEVELENQQEKTAEAREGAVEEAGTPPSIEPRRPLPGADVFPEEEDDDEPILGGSDDDEEDDDEAEGDDARPGDAQAGAESKSARRRRKRRRRGGADEAAEPEPRAREALPVREAREPRELRGQREAREPREPREPRNAREPRRDERRRERDEPRDRFEPRERLEPLDLQREPGDGDLLGKDLADAVASVLAQAGPRGLSAIRIADQLVRRGRLQGDPNALLPTIMASVRADIARKRVEQTRPRFRIEGSAVVLTEFLLPQEVVRAEQDVLRAAERQRERTRRAFLRRLGELPGAGIAELIATWLNAEGVIGLRAVRRPGAGVGELHLAGTLKRGADEVRLAIVVYREARELGRERVIEARGALHYYGNASMAWLITFGSVMSGAREEASAPAAGPVALYDGLSLATAMERQGVGLAVQYVATSALDFELLDALRGPLARERDFDQERGREPERGRERRERFERPERLERGERGERERGEAPERGERDRPERERTRLPLERAPRPSFEAESDLEAASEEAESEVALDEGDEVIDAALQAAGAGTAEGAEGDAREGSRRRRRRRRRKGRPDAQATAVDPLAPGADDPASAVWGEGDELDEGDEDEESLEAAEAASDQASTDDGAHTHESALSSDRDDEGADSFDDDTDDDADDADDDADADADQGDGGDERGASARRDPDDERDDERRRDADDEGDEDSDDELLGQGDSEAPGADVGDAEGPASEPPDREEGEGDAGDDGSREPFPGRRGHG